MGDIIVLLMLAGLVALVVRSMWNDRKKGVCCSGCSGKCSGCTVECQTKDKEVNI